MVANNYASHGSVVVSEKNGRLRLRLPRSVFGGQQKYLTLGMDDTPGNRVIAEAKAQLIESDIKLDRFDPTLAKYRPETFKLVDQNNKAKNKPKLNEVWFKYLEFISPTTSPSTMRNQYKVFTSYLNKLPTYDLEESEVILNHCVNNIPPESCKRFLVRINAACKWAIQLGLIDTNPFNGMASQVKIPKGQKQSEEFDINPFSTEERDRIIDAFRNNTVCHKNSRIKHSVYATYVEFCFMTGARPSEVIALKRKHISKDLRFIHFESSVVIAEGGRVEKKGLKTQEKRRFPVNGKLRGLLEEILEGKDDPEDLLFTSPESKTWLNTQNFSRRVWKAVLEGLGIKHRKPYQTRHTFITLALENGLDAKDVARVVGNSPEIIYKHYAGNKRDLAIPEF